MSLAAAHIKVLEDKIKSLEQLKTLESSESVLAPLRRYISHPTTLFDKYEGLDLLQSLVLLPRNESHKKADEYAAALDEIRTRTDALDHLQLQQVIGGSCSCLSFQGSHYYFEGRWQSSSCLLWLWIRCAQTAPLFASAKHSVLSMP